MIQRLAADSRFRFHLQTEAQERLGIQGLVDGNELLQVAKTFRMPLASLYPKIEEISLRYPRPGGRMPRQISLPTRLELERFMWLVGLLYGDGDGQGRLHMKDEEMLERARQILNRLTHRAYFAGSLTRVPFLCPGSSTFVRMLQVVFGYPAKRKAWSIRLPDLLHVAPMPLAAAFIRGYFDADGTVEKARSAVSATSVSEEFVDELQLLLLRFGVRGILLRRYGKSTLYVSGRRNLACMPQFSDPEKAALQKDLERKAGTSYVVDLLPVDWKRLGPGDWKSRTYAAAGQRPATVSLMSMSNLDISAAEPVVNEDVAFVEVKSIRSATEHWVYDFPLPR